MDIFSLRPKTPLLIFSGLSYRPIVPCDPMNHYKSSKQYRLRGYDYSQEGAYFITICTKDRIRSFGKINDGTMILSPVGKMAYQFWNEIPVRFPNAVLDEWVVMPDHFHGIIILNDDSRRNAPGRVPTETVSSRRVPTKIVSSRRVPTGIQPLIRNSISSIINHFKGNVKRWCNKNGSADFAWQPRFFDRIIRDNREMFFVRKYIRNNPATWDAEILNPQ